MTDEELARGAQVLLDMPVFHKIWDELEKQATSACIFAKATDHVSEQEARQAYAAEARAIIAFRNMLKSKAQASVSGRQAPA